MSLREDHLIVALAVFLHQHVNWAGAAARGVLGPAADFTK
jgi:hypothetical protein